MDNCKSSYKICIQVGMYRYECVFAVYWFTIGIAIFLYLLFHVYYSMPFQVMCCSWICIYLWNVLWSFETNIYMLCLAFNYYGLLVVDTVYLCILCLHLWFWYCFTSAVVSANLWDAFCSQNILFCFTKSVYTYICHSFTTSLELINHNLLPS